MLTVWKYQVKAEDYFEVELPSDHKILSVQEQEEGIVNFWALVNPHSPTSLARFRLCGTGHPITEDKEQLIYIGTVLIMSGRLVFHLFEILPYLLKGE